MCYVLTTEQVFNSSFRGSPGRRSLPFEACFPVQGLRDELHALPYK